MILITSVVCLLKTLNRYIFLAESLCSVNYVQPYMFQTLEEYFCHMAHFRGYRFFPGWFQVMSQLFSGWFQVFLDGFRVSELAEVYPENSVSRGLKTSFRKKQIVQNIYLEPLKILNCTSFYQD